MIGILTRNLGCVRPGSFDRVNSSFRCIRKMTYVCAWILLSLCLQVSVIAIEVKCEMKYLLLEFHSFVRKFGERDP